MPLPTAADVRAAAARLTGWAANTPLLRNSLLDAATGATVLLKTETLQRTGSFKFRGAFNRLAQLSPHERRAGVVAWSSGNHAQGVAAAAALLGIAATIVMPADAPRLKVERTRALGAKVIPYDRVREDREQIGRTIAAETGAVVVPPYDDPHVIAGQGTVGLEAMAQAAAMGVSIDDILIPASGGGLTAGIAVAVKSERPETRLFTVEPVGYDDHRRSWLSSARERNSSLAPALCDALLAATPGALTWRINRRVLSGGYAVTDSEVRTAMAFGFEVLKLVIEPSGAAALAALLAGHHAATGRVVVVVLSGGNVDGNIFAAVLNGA
ncbi:MAG: threonine/serine dehydratase [Rhodospirillaceae bacterium]|nr:MAG: threonine/serine dehydratase [Rhodospirillaceae bacterium]